jgi:hypothetical protein
MRDIDAYKAETDRLKVIAPAITPEQLQQIVAQAISDALGTPLKPIAAANSGTADEGNDTTDETAGETAGDDSAAPMPGAKKAPDGEYYVPDPTRPGQYIHVGKRAGGTSNG